MARRIGDGGAFASALAKASGVDGSVVGTEVVGRHGDKADVVVSIRNGRTVTRVTISAKFTNTARTRNARGHADSRGANDFCSMIRGGARDVMAGALDSIVSGGLLFLTDKERKKFAGMMKKSSRKILSGLFGDCGDGDDAVLVLSLVHDGSSAAHVKTRRGIDVFIGLGGFVRAAMSFTPMVSRGPKIEAAPASGVTGGKPLLVFKRKGGSSNGKGADDLQTQFCPMEMAFCALMGEFGDTVSFVITDGRGCRAGSSRPRVAEGREVLEYLLLRGLDKRLAKRAEGMF